MKRKPSKKWGKIGAPKSAKRRAYMRKIAKKRRGSIYLKMMFALVMIFMVLFGCLMIGGCNPVQVEQLQTGAAEAAPVVQDIGTGGQALMASPIAAFIPEPYRAIVAGVFFGLPYIANFLQYIGRRRVDKTLSVVTKTVEAQPEPVKATIKEDVAFNLKSAGMYEAGKTIISKAKAHV